MFRGLGFLLLPPGVGIHLVRMSRQELVVLSLGTVDIGQVSLLLWVQQFDGIWGEICLPGDWLQSLKAVGDCSSAGSVQCSI